MIPSDANESSHDVYNSEDISKAQVSSFDRLSMNPEILKNCFRKKR
jgi:hypothetical protein